MSLQPEKPAAGEVVSRAEIVRRTIENRRQLVDDVITEELSAITPDHLREVCQYLPDAGGKRLRPTVLLLVAESLADERTAEVNHRAVADSDVDMLRAAASLEILHTFTLIHDDLIDEDDLRRGVPAVHETYDASQAILAGDTLHSKAFELLAGVGAPPEQSARATSELANTCTRMCEGQSLDIAFESREVADPDEYLEMVTGKSAALYATAASLPAVLLGAEDAVDPLAGYGLDVGRAFQIKDDLLDLTTPAETLGKQRGSDLVEGKETLVTAHAREQGVDVDGLVEADSTADLDAATVEAAIAELEAAGSIDYARQMARDLVASGKAHLAVLPDGEPRDRLQMIADYVLEREY